MTTHELTVPTQHDGLSLGRYHPPALSSVRGTAFEQRLTTAQRRLLEIGEAANLLSVLRHHANNACHGLAEVIGSAALAPYAKALVTSLADERKLGADAEAVGRALRLPVYGDRTYYRKAHATTPLACVLLFCRLDVFGSRLAQTLAVLSRSPRCCRSCAGSAWTVTPAPDGRCPRTEACWRTCGTRSTTGARRTCGPWSWHTSTSSS
ncbi:hypothetical protein ACFQZ4_43425 [Catellatospora coxensis]